MLHGDAPRAEWAPQVGVERLPNLRGLGVRLGGVNSYRGIIEDRHTLGSGREPTKEDIEASTHLARLVGHSTVGSLLLT